MRIIFIDNNNYLTSTSLNLKALDSLEKIIINFSTELSARDHKVIIYNRANHEKNTGNIIWKNIIDLNNETADILILIQDFNFRNFNIKAKIKFLLLHYKPNENLNSGVLLDLLKNKICILFSNNYIVGDLPENFKYVPKLKLPIGVDQDFKQVMPYNSPHSYVFVTTHPLKGLDWLIDMWLKYIHAQIPWAELHIYSKLLEKNEPSNNIKIRNLKLTLDLNKDSGILIKSPLPQKKFISQLSKYKLHLCPSVTNDLQYLSILESQAAGIPVIARETESLHECIYHNETGYLVKDKQTFAKKVIQVLNDNKLFSMLRNNSKLNNYVISWQDVVTNFERTINENTFYR